MKITKAAVIFGVAAIAETTAGSRNPLKVSPSHLSLTHGANNNLDQGSNNNDGFDPANVYFEYLNRCAEADLNKESCLVSNTVNAFMEMDGPPPNDDDGNAPTTQRFLQQVDEDCDTPDVSEQDLRYIMGGAKDECIGSGIAISDQEFESTVDGFLKIFTNEECNQKLCSDQVASDPIFIEIMFDEAAKCAQVELDMPQCVRDQLFELILSGEGDSNGTETDGLQRRKLQDDSFGCEQPDEAELMLIWFVSMMLDETDVQGKCLERGVSLSSQQLDKAIIDTAKIFAAPHCWGEGGGGGGGCDEEPAQDDDYHLDHHHDDTTNNNGGMNYFTIAIKYIEQCASLELNTETCLVSNTLDIFMSWGATPMPGSPNHDQSSGHRRFLQMDSDGGPMCMAPELDSALLRYIVEESKYDCTSKGLVISDQEFENTLDDFKEIFGAQDCWVALCEEGSNPSDVLLKIMLEEIAACAGAKIDSVNPCLMDQLLAILFSPDSLGFDDDDDESDYSDAFDGLRRRLEHTVVGGGDLLVEDPCPDQPSDDEIYFVVSLLMAGAEELCIEQGESFQVGEIALAETELFKLFSAQQCWGVPNDCNEHNHHNHNDDSGAHTAYLEFLEESTTWILGQCADVDENSCVFSRSIEVMHGMQHLGWSHAGHNDPHHFAQVEVLNLCTPPTLNEYDIDQIAAHAKDHCLEAGAYVDEDHYLQAVSDLKHLVSQPDCWEDLCHPETKDMILNEWMDTCAMTDLKFLTNYSHYDNHSDDSLDNDILKCMAKFIADDIWEPDSTLLCTLPHVGSDLGNDVCNMNSGMDAYIHCGGEYNVVEQPTPPPSPPMHFSMSFAYDEDYYDWAHYEPLDEMSFSYSFSMPYTGFDDDDDWHNNVHDGSNEMMLKYIDEVCNLISDLKSDTAKHCLEPVCDGLSLEDALVFNNHDDDANTKDYGDDDYYYTTLSPSASPPSQTTQIPTRLEFILTSPPPTASPTLSPTLAPTTKQPTKKPTNQPSPSPTAIVFGEVEVAFEVAIKLDGLTMSDIDVTKLDEVVDLLESVFGDLLPEGAIVRIISVGGLSVVRRLMRFLQEDANSGVDVQFEVILKETCESQKCDESEALSETMYQSVTSDLREKVDSGELSSSLQEEANEAGLSEFSNVSFSSVEIGEKAVVVKEAQPADDDDENNDDDDSAALVTTTGIAAMVVVTASALVFV